MLSSELVLCWDRRDDAKARRLEGENSTPTTQPLSAKDITRTWWPLAGSWLLMSLEGPAVTAVVARLADPAINLAAFGGIVYPIAVLLESPIVMMLTASTALGRDWASYLKVRRFMHGLSGALTALHVLIAATPLYYLVVEGILHAPPETVGPARIGLLLMIPWTWSIGYRRFTQGMLIRSRRSLLVGVGSIVRLSADAVVLATGYSIGAVSGTSVAAAALSAGVMTEALFVFLVFRKPRDKLLKPARPIPRRLSTRELVRFYVPLSLTSVLTFVCMPIGTAVMSRMSRALESLAAWQVVNGASLLVRSPGIAYNEVVVALLDRPQSVVRLWRFAVVLGVLTTAGLLVLLIPPVGDAVFRGLLHLPPSVATLTQNSLWLLLPLPATGVLQSWFQGILVYRRTTRPVIESVAFFAVVVAGILGIGLAWGAYPGIYIGTLAFTAGEIARTMWLWFRARGVWAGLLARDSAALVEGEQVSLF